MCLQLYSYLLLQEYGRGSGKDCRVHVQKLNAIRGSLEEQQEIALEAQLMDECEGQAHEYWTMEGKGWLINDYYCQCGHRSNSF